MRLAAISFLNPAPLLYNFEHGPAASQLRTHYDVHYTLPSVCADELRTGVSDLGLVPIAALTPDLAIVPGCVIASLQEVRSILLLVKNADGRSRDAALLAVRSVAADSASRSSSTYTRILFEHFHSTRPTFHEEDAAQPGGPLRMLAASDAALLIGDPALLAREHRAAIDAAHPNLLWLDLAALWREHTGLPWVAAVWAVRPSSLTAINAEQLTADLTASRDAGLAHIDQLVAEWTPRIAIPPATIHTYLTHNIHYTLDDDCLRSIELFRKLAAQIGILPPLALNLL